MIPLNILIHNTFLLTWYISDKINNLFKITSISSVVLDRITLYYHLALDTVLTKCLQTSNMTCLVMSFSFFHKSTYFNYTKMNTYELATILVCWQERSPRTIVVSGHNPLTILRISVDCLKKLFMKLRDFLKNVLGSYLQKLWIPTFLFVGLPFWERSVTINLLADDILYISRGITSFYKDRYDRTNSNNISATFR